MSKEMIIRHVAWGCKTCNKIDWIDKKEATAKPEHVSHRGVDIGSCPGVMIKLWEKTDDPS